MRRSTTAALSERGYHFRTRQICPVTAALMGVEQENVARLERRADLLLSTLSSYVAAMGGKLRLIAEFPDRRSVAVALADITCKGQLKPRPRPRLRRDGAKEQPPAGG